MDSYLGEIRLCAFPVIPRGWLPCDGRLLNVNINQVLFALLGTQYGGDGRSTFGLPDLRGRVAMHRLPGTYNQGAPGGTETVTLNTQQVPAHTHEFRATTNDATQPIAGAGKDRLFAKSVIAQSGAPTVDGTALYGPVTAQTLAAESPEASSATSDATAHNNMQSSLVLNYIICVQGGLYPPRP